MERMQPEMLVHLTIIAVCWTVAVAAAGWALLRVFEKEARFGGFGAVLCAVAIAIGYAGFGRWSPFRFFPQIGYMWTSDDGRYRIGVASSWFFVVPLLMAGGAILLFAAKKNREGEQGRLKQ